MNINQNIAAQQDKMPIRLSVSTVQVRKVSAVEPQLDEIRGCVQHRVSLRTRQLGNTLSKDGYDKLEASSAAVAVQETPASKGEEVNGSPSRTTTKSPS